MTPREIVLANLNHTNPSRPGITFGGDRINDMLGAGISDPREQKRWIEDGVEFYDDQWGNIWKRMV